jgi:hypothetical protein
MLVSGSTSVKGSGLMNDLVMTARAADQIWQDLEMQDVTLKALSQANRGNREILAGRKDEMSCKGWDSWESESLSNSKILGVGGRKIKGSWICII